MEHPTFTDPKEEADYWHKKAIEYEQSLIDAREELEEFQTSSRELELELEAQLEHLEKRNQELLSHTEKLTTERDSYRDRVENSQSYWNQQVSHLQDEVNSIKQEKEKLRLYIRELEQVNDDLERAKRAALVSLEDFETRLNQTIERNAFLENELDEKQDLVVMVQRLKDETRDLHQELAVKRRQPSLTSPASVSQSESLISSRPAKLMSESTAQTENTSNLFPTSLLTPSVRIAALNLVNDALQKIGQLEFKLSTIYRSHGSPFLMSPTGALPSPNGLFTITNANNTASTNGLVAVNTAAAKPLFDRSSCLNGTTVIDRSGTNIATRESPVRVVD